jgi:hypothetical protein
MSNWALCRLSLRLHRPLKNDRFWNAHCARTQEPSGPFNKRWFLSDLLGHSMSFRIALRGFVLHVGLIRQRVRNLA